MIECVLKKIFLVGRCEQRNKYIYISYLGRYFFFFWKKSSCNKKAGVFNPFQGQVRKKHTHINWLRRSTIETLLRACLGLRLQTQNELLKLAKSVSEYDGSFGKFFWKSFWSDKRSNSRLSQSWILRLLLNRTSGRKARRCFVVNEIYAKTNIP